MQSAHFSYRMEALEHFGCGSVWLVVWFSFSSNWCCWSILLIVGPKLGLVSTHKNKQIKILYFTKIPISFSGNYEENESRGWYCALLSATFIQYAISLAGFVFLYIHYGCALNNFFITFNLILCGIVSVMSVMPQVQDHISRSGLLQSSVVTLYVVYLTWSALANNPNEACHSGISPDTKEGINRVRKLTIERILDKLLRFPFFSQLDFNWSHKHRWFNHLDGLLVV